MTRHIELKRLCTRCDVFKVERDAYLRMRGNLCVRVDCYEGLVYDIKAVTEDKIGQE